MTTHDTPSPMQTRCPVTQYETINVPSAAAGWHFDNFDAKREEAPIHSGLAAGNDYFLVTRLADIRASFQNHAVFSNSGGDADRSEPAVPVDSRDARPAYTYQVATVARAVVLANRDSGYGGKDPRALR